MAEKTARIFSPGFTGIKKIFYIFLRLSCLVFTCAALPLAYHYAQSQHLMQNMPTVLAWLAGIGAVFWGLLYLCLSQFAFSNTLSGAIIGTVGLYGNAVTGASLGDFNIFYGGYSAVWCSIVGQSLFLTGITIFTLVPQLKRKYFDSLPNWYGIFLLVCSVGLISMAWTLHGPFLTELASEGRIWLQTAYVALFLLQVYFEMKTLKEGSIIGNSAAKQSAATWSTYEAYMPFVAIGLVASLTVVLFMAAL